MAGRPKVQSLDPMWQELCDIEGFNPTKIGFTKHLSRLSMADYYEEQAERQRKEDEAAEAAKKPRLRPTVIFQHPTDPPTAHEIIKILSLSEDTTTGYGDLGLYTAHRLALAADAMLYNAWVRHQCREQNLIGPGVLSDQDFCDRFWVDLEDDK